MPRNSPIVDPPAQRPGYLPEQPRQLRITSLDLRHSTPGGKPAALLRDLESSHPQFGSDWLCNLALHALDEGEVARLYVAEEAGGGLVVLPLKISRDGNSAEALGNFYTSLYSPGIDCTDPVRLFTALFRHLARRDGLASLTLSPMDGASPVFRVLLESLHAAGWKGVHRFFCFANWVQPLDGMDWPQYLAGRPSRLRNTLKRRRRKLLEAGRGRIEIVRGETELAAAIEVFTRIYNRSWKRPEPYPGFMPGLLRLAARRGWLRLGIAYYDGRPIAAQVWLVSEGTAYIFKLAYDAEYGGLSPGTLLTAELMQYVIERDRVTTVDYLSGDDAYKRDWMSVRRERSGIAAYNPRKITGLGRLLDYRAREAVKRLSALASLPGKSPTPAARD